MSGQARQKPDLHLNNLLSIQSKLVIEWFPRIL